MYTCFTNIMSSLSDDAAHVVCSESKRQLYADLLGQIIAQVDGNDTHALHDGCHTSATYARTKLGTVTRLCLNALNRFAMRNKGTLEANPVSFVGIYLFTAPDTLTLGPFHGAPAQEGTCLGMDTVCGAAVRSGRAVRRNACAHAHDEEDSSVGDATTLPLVEMAIPIWQSSNNSSRGDGGSVVQANLAARTSKEVHEETALKEAADCVVSNADETRCTAVSTKVSRCATSKEATHPYHDFMISSSSSSNNNVVAVWCVRGTPEAALFDAEDELEWALLLRALSEHIDFDALTHNHRRPACPTPPAPTACPNHTSLPHTPTRSPCFIPTSCHASVPKGPHTSRTLLPPPPRVTHTDTRKKSDPAKPVMRTRLELDGWVFCVYRLDRIASQADLTRLEDALGIAAFPEMLFLHNRVTLARRRRHGHNKSRLGCGDAQASARARADSCSSQGKEGEAAAAAVVVTRDVCAVHDEDSEVDSTCRPESTTHMDEADAVLDLNACAVLAAGASFYRTERYRAEVAKQLVLPCQPWRDHAKRYKVFDAHIDWAWRQEFIALCPPHEQHTRNESHFGENELETDKEQPDSRIRVEDGPCPCVDDNIDASRWMNVYVPAHDGRCVPNHGAMSGIDTLLLRDTTVPILLYDDVLLMEDDLHDNGMMTMRVKVRVMRSGFLILQRHVVRIDRVAVWIREVRYFHKCVPDSYTKIVYAERPAGTSAGAQETGARMVVQVQLKKLVFDNASMAGLSELSEDEMSQMAPCVDKDEFYLDL